MKKDLPKVVKKVSTFLGVNASESRIKEICTKSSFSEMKTNTEKENYDPNRTVCALTSNRRLIFRKGQWDSLTHERFPRSPAQSSLIANGDTIHTFQRT
uniref:Uncharacterized protein n=1 Tax=Sphaerodactylus townsendi TaxID=933632 RepID=A0ACB8FLN9_9SAUR